MNNTTLDNKIIRDYEYLKQFDNDTIIYLINEYFSEEEKISLLRNTTFIISFPSDLIEIMINNMSFVSVLNMMQNNLLLNKIKHINVKLTQKDILIAKDMLTLYDLVEKFSSNMLKTIIINQNKKDIIDLLNNDKIFKLIDKEDLIDIVAKKRINLVNDINIINNLNKDELFTYINGYLKNNMDYSLMNNKHVVKTLLAKKDIDLDDVNYLYDLLTTKCNHLIKNMKHNVISYKSVMSMYYLLGFNKCLNIISEVSDVNALVNGFRYVDIDKIEKSEKLDNFIISNLDKILSNEYNILSYGTLINNFNSNYHTFSGLEKHILDELNVKDIDKDVLKKVLNNDFNSNLKGIANNINNKKLKLNNYNPGILLDNDNEFVLVTNQELLSSNSKLDNNSFTIKTNDNSYIYGSIKVNKVYLNTNDNINNNILKDISSNIIENNNIDEVILNGVKNIDGIRLNNSIIIDYNKEIKEEKVIKKIK